MKASGIVAPVLALLTVACCHRGPVPGTSSKAQEAPTLQASCYFTAEATYDRIELEGGILRVTSFEDISGRCAQWYASTPCWRPEDLRTREVRLSAEALSSFVRTVEVSGFLDLPATTGGDPGEGGRYYPYTLTVSIGGRERAVTHRSFPGGEEMPPAFNRVWEALHALAR